MLFQGRNIRKWFYNEEVMRISFTRRGFEIDNYQTLRNLFITVSAIFDTQENYDDDFGRKPGLYKWFEILDNTAYYKEFEQMMKKLLGTNC